MCFVAGTQVLTEDGLQSIETLHLGDKVLTANEYGDGGDQDVSFVTGVYVTHPTELYEVVYADAEGEHYTLAVTGEHPVRTANGEWEAVGDLTTINSINSRHTNGINFSAKHI